MQSSKGDANWMVASFSPDSVIRWTKYIGTTGNDFAKGIFVDSLFSVYVVGDVASSGNSDVQVCKIDSAGNSIWNSTFGRSSNSEDNATSVSVLNGNVFVGGNSQATNGFYDYTILKYNSSGSLQWSQFYNGGGNKDDFTTGVAIKPNGHVYVTGYSKNSANNFDYATVKLNGNGNIQWSQTYGGTIGKDDFANAIDVDDDGFIYVTGQSFVTTTNSDYVTIKYDNGGTQRWVARYDGPAHKIDKAVAITSRPSGQIFITGSSDRNNGNADYATIKYSSNGQMQWVQRYNGTGNGEDDATAIILDGAHVVVTGNSLNTSGFFDHTTLSYEAPTGNIHWTKRYDGENSATSDIPSALSVDEMGNVYVAGIVGNSSSSNSISLTKINQLHKNENKIELNLQMLAHGFLAIRNNSSAKQIMLDQIELVVDSFTQVRIQAFLNKCVANGLNVVPLMNDSISKFYLLDTSYNWMKILLKRIYYQENKVSPMVYVDDFYYFTEAEFINSNLDVAYTYFETDYPFPCLTTTSGLLTRGPNIVPSLNVIVRPKPWITKTPQILMCSASGFTDNPSFFCSVCTPSPIGPLLTSSPSSTQNHEIGLKIGEFYNGVWGSPGAPEDCFFVGDANSTDMFYPAGYYAVLRALPGFPYYARSSLAGYATIYKIPLPIKESQFNLGSGFSATLCEEFEDCSAWGSTSGKFQLGQGGVYEISRLGSNQRPLYFSFPYSQGLWYQDGPDLNIAYGTNPDIQNLSTCTNGGIATTEDYFIGPCQVCGQGQSVFGLTAFQEGNVLATTDVGAITSYWRDNAITVGLCLNAQSYAVGNAYTFYADNNTANDCTPSAYSSLNLVGQLKFLQNGNYYEVQKNFINNATFAPGSNLLIHVTAKFQNGESIDNCLPITIHPDPLNPTFSFSNISVEIRGNINDFDPNNSSLIFYQVDIYQ